VTFCDHVGRSRQALRIAVDQTRANITDVAILDKAATQLTMFIAARYAVINEYEPSSVGKSGGGKGHIGVHIHLHPAHRRLMRVSRGIDGRRNEITVALPLNSIFDS
jgi:hypothetical protein